MATIARNDRNEGIDRVLANLVSVRGVTTAALVDGDGLVTHIRRDFEMDSDALGAAAQIVFSSARRAAQQVRQDDVKVVISENQDGMVLLAPLSRGFVLCLVSDTSGMLGTIRFEMREALPELTNLLGR
jgi:predicted regulator of Ras-like GTPase activity (Roadblock/LC7/MglB family)